MVAKQLYATTYMLSLHEAWENELEGFGYVRKYFWNVVCSCVLVWEAQFKPATYSSCDPFLHLEEQSAAQRATLELRKDLVPRASFGGSSCRLTIRYGSFDPCRAGSIRTKSWSWKILSQVSPEWEVITWCLIVYWLHLTTVYKMNQSFLGKYSVSCVVLPLSSVLILLRSFTSRGDM